MRRSSSARYTITTPQASLSKVELVNCRIADVLRSFAGERADDWQALVPLVEFAINDSEVQRRPSAGLAESPRRPSRESLKTPSRAELRVALN